MGSPYNYLQQITFSYSGREIGITQYKPYTFGSEEANLSASIRGSLFQAIVESSPQIISNLKSGGLNAALIEKGSLDLKVSGLLTAQPGDETKFKTYVTGNVDGVLADTDRLGIFITGRFDEGLHESMSRFGAYSHTGEFIDFTRDQGRLKSSFGSGNLVALRKDVCSITFLMFSGTYSSGTYVPPAANYPFTGTEQASMTFVIFSGSYQGS